jgi:CRISPR-associated protein Cas5d
VKESCSITIEVHGDWALFNQPCFRSERISHLIPSHSAAVGIFRGVLGHKAIDWEVSRLELLSEPTYHPMLINELSFDSTPLDRPVCVETARTQRNNVFLRNYRCRLTARFTLSSLAEANDNIIKFERMMSDRLRNGVERRHVYLGIKECKAHIEIAEGPVEPINITSNFGLMFYDVDWKDPSHPYYFAPMQMVNGIANYPSWPDVRKLGVKRDMRVSA